MFQIFKQPAVKLSDSDLALLVRARDAVLCNSQRLALEAWGKGSARWKLLPKHHALLELCAFTLETKFNPGYAWTFADEDHARKLAKISLACHVPSVEKEAAMRELDILRLRFG